jgi:hypothetical protein
MRMTCGDSCRTTEANGPTWGFLARARAVLGAT